MRRMRPTCKDIAQFVGDFPNWGRGPWKKDSIHRGGTSKRRYRREMAKQPIHECAICSGLHHEVRRYHGIALGRMRREADSNGGIVSTARSEWMYWELVRFERQIHDADKRWREHDRQLAERKVQR